jgi:hypothetical protein
MPVLDTRRDILAERQRQGADSRVVLQLLQLLDREREIQLDEFTAEKSKRELEQARQECAQMIAGILPQLNTEIDTWASGAQRKADAEPKRLNRKTVAELQAIDAMLARADDPNEIEALVSEVVRDGDANSLKACWSAAKKKLTELAASEQRRHRINGRAFFLLTTLEARVGKILKAELPSERSRDIVDESQRRKASARRMALECAAVLQLDKMVTRAELELKAAAPSNTVFGSFWENVAVQRRAR